MRRRQCFTIPAGSQHFQTTVPMTYNGVTFDVVIDLGLNLRPGSSRHLPIDRPEHRAAPANVLTGFLPPENGTGRGMGYVSYMIVPNPGLPTGTQIRNVAIIAFDDNPPIATDQVNDNDPSQGIDPTRQDLITIDSGAPQAPWPLPAESVSTFTVSWSGQDDRAARASLYVPHLRLRRWRSVHRGKSGRHRPRPLSRARRPHLQLLQRRRRQRRQRPGNPDDRPGDDHGRHRPEHPGDIQRHEPHLRPVSDLRSQVSPAASNLPDPTGTVQFLVNYNNFGSPVNLVNGVAYSPSLSTLGAGAARHHRFLPGRRQLCPRRGRTRRDGRQGHLDRHRGRPDHNLREPSPHPDLQPQRLRQQ